MAWVLYHAFLFHFINFVKNVISIIMKKFYIVAVIIFITLPLSGQNLWLGAEGQKFYEELLVRKAVTGEEAIYEGSPYLSEEKESLEQRKPAARSVSPSS